MLGGFLFNATFFNFAHLCFLHVFSHDRFVFYMRIEAELPGPLSQTTANYMKTISISIKRLVLFGQMEELKCMLKVND